MELKLKQEADFLGLSLDEKLSCMVVTGYWGGNGTSDLELLYTAVVRPILTYGCLIWWESFDWNFISKLI